MQKTFSDENHLVIKNSFQYSKIIISIIRLTNNSIYDITISVLI